VSEAVATYRQGAGFGASRPQRAGDPSTIGPSAGSKGAEPLACLHCGLPSHGDTFCCSGCEAAFEVINGLGLGGYYLRRLLDPAARALKPEPEARADLERHIATAADGAHTLMLAVDGVQCAACVWLIESVLAREPALTSARMNMTTRRLRLSWRGDAALAQHFCGVVEQLGYRLVPFDPACLAAATDKAGRALLRALAVAGFAAGNVMLISLGTWFGLTQNMGPATRDLMHWVSALIALPAIAYSGMVFFRSAAGALRHGRTNMDVPISVGVILVTAMSLWQTIEGGVHTYFDSAVTLLFFLLIGRVLDQRARGQARTTAEQLLLLRTTDVTVRQTDGTVRRVPQSQVAPGDLALAGMGERVDVDGVLESETASLDTGLVTGESLPESAARGTRIFAGTINLGAAITVRVTATGDATLLAECVRLIEAAEQARGKFVILTDRVARFYAPVVHACALSTFLVWWSLLHRGVPDSLMAAAAVLIITCPCALALAVPAVQVIATSRLFRAGILLKSPTALERLAAIDTVVFDKTGTLTEPDLALANTAPAEALGMAAELAAHSRHPLCRALARAAGGARMVEGVTELSGQGLACQSPAGEIRLGSRAFCGLPHGEAEGPELCLTQPGKNPTIFSFAESVRRDAAAVIETLRRSGLELRIASGDQEKAVGRVAEALGIKKFQSRQSPMQKSATIQALREAGRHVLMVGDGLNDSPCLAAADVSAAPSSAADISQTVADIVFQGDALSPVASVLHMARRARSAMRQNLALSIGYNAIMLPLAACGYVTPWLAALAMSSSSILVMLNALRLQRIKL
jgi:Cu2+-exporting ATPase